jgi:hypothetical protein
VPRGDDRARYQFPLGSVGENVNEVHRKLFRIVVDHHQVAEVANDVLLINFDLYLRRLLFRHFSSVSLHFKLSQMPSGKHGAQVLPPGVSKPFCDWCLSSDPAGEPVLTMGNVKCSLVYAFI